MVRNINKLVRYLKSRKVSLRYGDMWHGGRQATLTKLHTLTLFGFSDAGYAQLKEHKSQESRIPICGKVLRRDGMIHGVGSPIDFFSRKITSTAKSTISAEAVALSNVADLGIWVQISLM